MLIWLSIIAAILIVAVIIYYLIDRRNERERYDFITIIAHKFRTPLTVVKWSTESLLESSIDAYQKQSLMDIQESSQKLISLTSLLVELTDPANASRAAYKFERMDVCDLIHEAEAEAKTAMHEKNIFIAIRCPEPAIFIKADRARLRFAIDTILENACAYSPAGRNVEIGVERHGRKAVISVTDHGIGIEPADQARIFERFFRTKDARSANTEGFGVGLYLAREAVRRHKGTIKLYSAGAGTGATFSMIVPRVR